jgi:hypothetical protein
MMHWVRDWFDMTLFQPHPYIWPSSSKATVCRQPPAICEEIWAHNSLSYTWQIPIFCSFFMWLMSDNDQIEQKKKNTWKNEQWGSGTHTLRIFLFLRAWTWCGTRWSWKFPWPNWPYLLHPNVYRLPDSATVIVCRHPHATIFDFLPLHWLLPFHLSGTVLSLSLSLQTLNGTQIMNTPIKPSGLNMIKD